MRVGVIYKIRCDRYFIFGSTLTPAKRKNFHLWQLNTGIHDNDYFQNVYNKYKDFRFEVVQEDIPEDILKYSEDIWIGANCAKVMDGKCGLNIIDGSRMVFTEEILRKKSEAQREVMQNLSKDQMDDRMRKMTKSKAPKLKAIGLSISKAKKENPKLDWDNNQTRPIVQLSKKGEFIKLWASAYQAQKNKDLDLLIFQEFVERYMGIKLIRDLNGDLQQKKI